MDLDDLLDSSAPPVTARTPQLRRELDDLVTASETAQARRPRPIRLAVAGAVAVGAVGLGSVASAAGVLPGWPSFSTSSGQSCEIEVWVRALQPGEGGEASDPIFTAAERAAALGEARRYLADFDYAGVDREAALAAWQQEEAKARAMQTDPAERQPRLTGDDLEVTAVGHWVISHLQAHLTDEGLDLRALSVGFGSSGCVL